MGLAVPTWNERYERKNGAITRLLRVLRATVCLLSHGAGYFCEGNKSFFESCPVLSAFRLAAGRARREAPSRRGRLILKIQNFTPHFLCRTFCVALQLHARRKKEKREL